MVTSSTHLEMGKSSNDHYEATVIVQKVGSLQVTIEALDFASRTHRANLEKLLLDCDEAKTLSNDESDKD
jgi:hypothetical protein